MIASFASIGRARIILSGTSGKDEMPRRRAALIAQLSLPLLLLIALAVPSVPQTQDPATTSQRPRKVFPKEQEPEDVLKFDTDLVSVDVTAMDNEGRPVKNLRQEDFKVYSDNV